MFRPDLTSYAAREIVLPDRSSGGGVKSSLSALVALSMLCGCAVQTHGPAEKVVLDGIEFQLKSARYADSLPSIVTPRKADANFLVVDLELTNVTKSPRQSLFKPQCRLIDNAGAMYAADEHLSMMADAGSGRMRMLSGLNPGVHVP